MGKEDLVSAQQRVESYGRDSESEVDRLVKAMKRQTTKLKKHDEDEEDSPPPAPADTDELEGNGDDEEDMGDDDGDMDDEEDMSDDDGDMDDEEEEEAPPPPPAKPAKRQAATPPPAPSVKKSKFVMEDDDFLAAMILNENGEPVEGASFIDASEILSSLVEGMAKGMAALSTQMGTLEIALDRAERLNMQMAKSLMATQEEVQTLRKSYLAAPTEAPAPGQRYNVMGEIPNTQRVNRNTTQGLSKSMVGDALREFAAVGALDKATYTAVAGSLDSLGIEGALSLIDDAELRASVVQAARQA